MNKQKATRALRAVEKKYADWLKMDGSKGTEYGPQLRQSWYQDGDWCIVWEQGSPDEWAIKWGDTETDPEGIFLEPIYSFVLGVYDA